MSEGKWLNVGFTALGILLGVVSAGFTMTAYISSSIDSAATRISQNLSQTVTPQITSLKEVVDRVGKQSDTHTTDLAVIRSQLIQFGLRQDSYQKVTFGALTKGNLINPDVAQILGVGSDFSVNDAAAVWSQTKEFDVQDFLKSFQDGTPPEGLMIEMDKP